MKSQGNEAIRERVLIKYFSRGNWKTEEKYFFIKLKEILIRYYSKESNLFLIYYRNETQFAISSTVELSF